MSAYEEAREEREKWAACGIGALAGMLISYDLAGDINFSLSVDRVREIVEAYDAAAEKCHKALTGATQ